MFFLISFVNFYFLIIYSFPICFICCFPFHSFFGCYCTISVSSLVCINVFNYFIFLFLNFHLYFLILSFVSFFFFIFSFFIYFYFFFSLFFISIIFVSFLILFNIDFLFPFFLSNYYFIIRIAMELNIYSVRYRSMVVVNGLRILRVAVGRIQVSPMVAGGEMDK